MGVQRRAKQLGWSGDYGNHGNRSRGRYDDDDDDEGGRGLLHTMLCDLVFAFLWSWSLAMIRLTPGRTWFPMAIKYVLTRFAFARLRIAAGGGLFNPLSALSSSLSGGPHGPLATLVGRIPAQVIGYVIGVKTLLRALPEYYGGPQLNVNLMVGVIVEGFLAFLALFAYMLLKETEQGFFTKTFISSIFRLILRGLGSVFAVGCMNPGSAFGWAYASGDHMSKELVLVYWIAPMGATVFGMWAYDSLIHPDNQRLKFDGAVTSWRKSD